MSKAEKRKYNQKVNDKERILRHLFSVKSCSRRQLCDVLGLSMPTVSKKISELNDEGLISIRTTPSSGNGRKATIVTLRQNAYYSIGVEIQKHFIRLILLNFHGKPVLRRQHRLEYSNSDDYIQALSDMTEALILDENIAPERVLGVCISWPGTIDYQCDSVTLALTLQERDLPLSRYRERFRYPLFFTQDAKASCLREILNHPEMPNFVFLYISQLIGGAVVHNGKLLLSRNSRNGEFGHTCLVPRGRRCYCGNEGCVDAYLSTGVLSEMGGGSLKAFFSKLQGGDTFCLSAWYRYMDHLIVLLYNLNMAYNTPIMLSGELAPYLKPWIEYINARVSDLNFFHDGVQILLSANDITDDALGAGLISLLHFFRVYK